MLFTSLLSSQISTIGYYWYHCFLLTANLRTPYLVVVGLEMDPTIDIEVMVLMSAFSGQTKSVADILYDRIIFTSNLFLPAADWPRVLPTSKRGFLVVGVFTRTNDPSRWSFVKGWIPFQFSLSSSSELSSASNSKSEGTFYNILQLY